MRKSKSHAGRTPPGQRQLRVGEQIRHLLAEILQRGRFRDPDLLDAHKITVTAVDIGPDLQHAVAYIMPLGGEKASEWVEALNRASGFFRGELAHRLDLRYTPKVTFKLDTSFDEADRIEKLLRQDRVQKDVLKKDDA